MSIAEIVRHTALFDIDGDEWCEFISFCCREKVGYKVVYDGEDVVMVRMKIKDMIGYTMWMVLGESPDDINRV